jgi:hypothetical protein
MIIIRILLLPFMLLTAPTIEELQNLEMASLVDMLAEQTGFYTKFINEVTHESETYRQLIVDIQKAIELKANPTNNTNAANTTNRYIRYKI